MKSVWRASLRVFNRACHEEPERSERPATPKIRILDMLLGDATEFEIDKDFNADVPVPIRCRSCGGLLHVDWRLQRLVYSHPKQNVDWCKAPTPFIVSPHAILEATLRAVLEKAPTEPDKTVYERLRRWIENVYFDPIGYERSLIYVELREPERSAA